MAAEAVLSSAAAVAVAALSSAVLLPWASSAQFLDLLWAPKASPLKHLHLLTTAVKLKLLRPWVSPLQSWELLGSWASVAQALELLRLQVLRS